MAKQMTTELAAVDNPLYATLELISTRVLRGSSENTASPTACAPPVEQRGPVNGPSSPCTTSRSSEMASQTGRTGDAGGPQPVVSPALHATDVALPVHRVAKRTIRTCVAPRTVRPDPPAEFRHGDSQEQARLRGIGRGLRPGTGVPATVLISDMGSGALYLEGYRSGPSVYLTAGEAVPSRDDPGQAL